MNNRHGSATVSLPSDCEIVITRVFDAPAALVFEAWTRPEHVRRWWGNEAMPVVQCDIDLRVGGAWRYVVRTAEGVELGWHGVYREIEAPHRLVSTEVFEGYPDAEAVNTLVLTEGNDGSTLAHVTVLHSSKENRDGHVNSGMEGGMQESMNQMEDLVASMAAPITVTPRSVADRYRNVAGTFTARVAGVPSDAWDNAAPCDGWVARDIVRHLVTWVPPFLTGGAALAVPTGPSVDDDPLGAWTTLSDAIQHVLDDPDVGSRAFAHPQAGSHPLDQAIGMFIMGDVLIHTWDLARATGQDETLDAAEVAGMYEGMLPIDAMLRTSGHYGPRVDVPNTADVQTKLIAFTGRHP
jgi:uncharacterized protein (TIGR03086 family)